MIVSIVLVWLLFVVGVSSTGSRITELTDSSFGEFAKSREFLFVNFYAPWCSDSKALAPELEDVSLILGKRSSDVAKVDCFGEGKSLCTSLGIKHWPTLKTFRRGVVTSEYMGAHRAEAIANYINGAEDILVAPVSTDKISAAALQAPSPAPAPATPAQAPAQAPAQSTVISAETPVVTAPENSNGWSEPQWTDGPGAETSQTTYQIPSEGGRVVSTSEETLPIKLPQNGVTMTTNGQPHETARIVTPSAEILNALECAKCRILTPEQRKLSPGCKTYKRECIPNFHKQEVVKMVPGGSGKKRRRR